MQPPQQPGPYQQPPNQQYYPYMPPTVPQSPRKKRRIWRYILAGLIILIAISICRGIATSNPTSTDATPTPASTTSSTSQQSKAAPTTQPTALSIHYPPTSLADLHGLAAKGNAGAVHEFHSESVGDIGVCPQPKREVTVAPSLTGQALAENLLAYFYSQQMDNTCGSVVFAYHSQAEANDVYTAGRVMLDVTDVNGSVNTNPNATGLKYKLTLDTGSAIQNQEYVILY